MGWSAHRSLRLAVSRGVIPRGRSGVPAWPGRLICCGAPSTGEADLMASRLTVLTPADIQRFERDGYVVVRQAFSPANALAMERQWWRELEGTYGIRRDDCSSWRQIPGDLKAAKHDPSQDRILTGRVRGVLDDLLGQAAWAPPRDWGRPLVTFPEPGAWDVPARLWHWDNPCDLHLDHPRALF